LYYTEICRVERLNRKPFVDDVPILFHGLLEKWYSKYVN
jgi:hypothetical protein